VTGVVGAIAGTAIWVDPIVNIHSSDKEIIGVLLQNVEVMAIVAALIVYLKEVPERKAQRHYEAWQLIVLQQQRLQQATPGSRHLRT
jgi:hypothetical protein